jgi:hypothetical protein
MAPYLIPQTGRRLRHLGNPNLYKSCAPCPSAYLRVPGLPITILHCTIYYLGYPLGRFAGLKHRQLARQVGADHHHRRTRRTSSSKTIYQDQSIRRRAVPIGGHHTSRRHASPWLDISVCQIWAHGGFNFAPTASPKRNRGGYLIYIKTEAKSNNKFFFHLGVKDCHVSGQSWTRINQEASKLKSSHSILQLETQIAIHSSLSKINACKQQVDRCMCMRGWKANRKLFATCTQKHTR